MGDEFNPDEEFEEAKNAVLQQEAEERRTEEKRSGEIIDELRLDRIADEVEQHEERQKSLGTDSDSE